MKEDRKRWMGEEKEEIYERRRKGDMGKKGGLRNESLRKDPVNEEEKRSQAHEQIMGKKVKNIRKTDKMQIINECNEQEKQE